MGYIIGRQVPSHCSKVIEMGCAGVPLGSRSSAHCKLGQISTPASCLIVCLLAVSLRACRLIVPD